MHTNLGWGQPIIDGECPFCSQLPQVNEHSVEVIDLRVSAWRLSRDQGNPGNSLLIFRIRHAESIAELSDVELQAFSADLRTADRCLQRSLHPDHMNYAVLGNVVPHLHWHLIPRYRTETRWGMPVWTTARNEMKTDFPELSALFKLCARLRRELASLSNL
jgi:diadenosine tetraphosphate (Ap4A) HIT family hydrolase